MPLARSPAGREPIPFVEGCIDGVTITPLAAHVDDRGWLTELYRDDELPAADCPVMAYISETEPGVARGPHEHVEQTDVFVFLGIGRWRLYLWDARPESPTYARQQKLDMDPQDRVRVVVPPGVVHAYKNTGTTPGWVFNAANRLYAGAGRAFPIDEIRHENRPDSPYVLD